MKKFIFLILILTLAFFLRSNMVLHGDFWYLFDQARDLLLAKSIVVDHKLTLIGGRTGFGGLFHGALWIYIITPFFIAAKGNPFLTLVPLFEIVNLGLVFAGFFVGWKLYGKTTGLLIAFFLAISKPLIDASTGVTNAEMLPIVFIFYIYSVVRFLRGDDKFFALSLFLIGLGFQFESAFAVLLVPITLFAVVLKGKLPRIRELVLGISGFFVAVSTFIIFDIRHQFLMTTSAIKLFTNTQKPLPGYEQYANIGFRFFDRVFNLWQSLFTPLYSQELITSIFLVFFLGLSVLIILKRIYFKQINIFEKEVIFLFLLPVIIFGIYIIYPLPLWPHYLLPTAVSAIFVLVLSIKLLSTKPILFPLILIFLFLSLITPAVSIYDQYFLNKYHPQSDGSYINQLNVSKWVYNDSLSKNSSYFVYNPGILTYNMDYLLWWQFYKNMKPQLRNLKTKNTYLVFYPHKASDNNAYLYWKKNVIKTTGDSYYGKKFNGGILVEKIDLSKDKQQVDPNYFQNLIFR